MNDAKKPKNETRKTVFAKKSFGQNFLVDQNYIDKIIAALNPQPNETIIEIGAGRGALTERLVEKAGKVFAIELDRDLIPLIKVKFKGFNNFEIIEADALKIDFRELTKTNDQNSKIKLVANLPYYISTAVLQRLIEQKNYFSEMVLMFQREVVGRIAAKAGNSERGFLTVLTEAYLTAEKLFDVPPNAFRPAPKVWSSVVRLTPKSDVGIENEKLFRAIVSAGFARKRKTILNNLKNFSKSLDMKSALEKSGVKTERRAEDLSLEEWKRLSEMINTENL